MKNISEAKAELSKLIEYVLRGGEVVIGKAGKPVAKLVAFHGTGIVRTPGALKGQIQISPDFNEFSDELASLFGLSDTDTKAPPKKKVAKNRKRS